MYTFCSITYQNRFRTNENVHIQNHIHVLYKITGHTIHLYNLGQNVTKDTSVITELHLFNFLFTCGFITTTLTINVSLHIAKEK